MSKKFVHDVSDLLATGGFSILHHPEWTDEYAAKVVVGSVLSLLTIVSFIGLIVRLVT